MIDRSVTDATRPAIRVLIVEDHDMVSDALAMALDRAEDIEVVGQAATLREAMARVAATRPDVVILDRRLPDGDAIAALERFRTFTEARFLLLTGDANPALATRAVEAGATGLILKSSRLEELAEAVRIVAAGRTTFDPRLLGAVLDQLSGRVPPTGADLTARELETLHLLAGGASTEQISGRMGIARNTTRNHVQRLLDKLGARSKLEAVAIARREGLVD